MTDKLIKQRKRVTNIEYKNTFFESLPHERPFRIWLIITFQIGKRKSRKVDVKEFSSWRGFKFVHNKMKYWIKKHRAKREIECQEKI